MEQLAHLAPEHTGSDVFVFRPIAQLTWLNDKQSDFSNLSHKSRSFTRHMVTHREILLNQPEFILYLAFPIDLAPNGCPFDSRSIAK